MGRQTKKPRADFPLFLHKNGQWCKKVRGKLLYFGVDPVEAERRWDTQKVDLPAGRKPRSA